MALRRIAWLLAIFAMAIQWPLWFGKGGWLRVWELQQQLEAQRADNATLGERNAALAAELDSLRAGREAIEERARAQLTMLRPDEVFVQYVPRSGAAQPPAETAAPLAAAAEPPAAPAAAAAAAATAGARSASGTRGPPR